METIIAIIGVLLAFGGGGYYLYRDSKRAAAHKRLYSIVVGGEHSISKIAAVCQWSEVQTEKELQRVINKANEGYAEVKLFKKAYIDSARRIIVLNEDVIEASQQVSGAANIKNPLLKKAAGLFADTDTPIVRKNITVACTGCGAKNNVTVGRAARCEYCNAAISTNSTA